MDIQPEPHVITSVDLVSGQRFMMDVGVGIGTLYEVLETQEKGDSELLDRMFDIKRQEKEIDGTYPE